VIDEEYKNERLILNDKINEVEALLSIPDMSYEDRMTVLRNYNIVDKKGVLK